MRVAMSDQSAGGEVRSVRTALDVLDCFSTEEELGVTDIARRLGVAKSTAHRLLTTLCARGITERDLGSGRYRLGLHLFELGQLARDRAPLYRASLPLLAELRHETGLTVGLGVAEGADVVFLERLASLRAIPLLVPGARRMPVHVTSAGQALAAFDTAVAQARIAAGFPALTSRTITSAAKFEIALARVRRTGFAATDGEARPGLASVAVPVRDRMSRVCAALSVTGPSHEVVPAVGRFVEALGATAARLSRSLAD